jgi:WD40 repeat protein
VFLQEIEDPDPNSIMVYDLQTGLLFRKWKHDFSATSVAVSSKTSLVVSGHEDGTVIVWDLIGGSAK